MKDCSIVVRKSDDGGLWGANLRERLLTRKGGEMLRGDGDE